MRFRCSSEDVECFLRCWVVQLDVILRSEVLVEAGVLSKSVRLLRMLRCYVQGKTDTCEGVSFFGNCVDPVLLVAELFIQMSPAVVLASETSGYLIVRCKY